MATKRIYQAAKDFDLTSKALVQLLRDMGFEVKSHMSVFTEKMAESINQRLHKEKEKVKKKEEKKEKIQRAAEVKSEIGKYKKHKKRRKKKKNKGHDYAVEMRKLEAERRKRREELLKTITKEKVTDSVKKTLAQLSQTKKKKKYHRKAEIIEEKITDPDILQVHEFLTTQELAKRLDIPPTELVGYCFKELGIMVTLNQRLDFDTISLIAESFEKKIEKISPEAEEIIEEEEEDETKLVQRTPVVTVMGHVDHGKTTLLDYIRKSKVVAGEMGGITQHVGAYTVETEYGVITFIDTPGHRAFTAMRARGAQITDIVVLVVDWKDGVMPQTKEAISHANAAGVPIIIAINKMDLPGASTDKVMQQLSELGLTCDQWGGDTLCVQISAVNGMGIETLIEYIILQAELLELKANPNKPARGVVIEAKLDKGRGPIATVLIRQGTLYKGDSFVVGVHSGKVRNLFDERGKILDNAGLSRPVRIIGIDGVPTAGDSFFVVESEKVANEISSQRRTIREQQERYRVQKVSLQDFYQKVEDGKQKSLRVILKGDVGGSIEAIADMLAKSGNENIKVDVIHLGVGAITENDILLAAASGGIVIGFNSKPDARAREIAYREKVEIRIYSVIYDIENDIKKALEGMLEPEVHEEYLGNAEILKVFKVSGSGKIAGLMINEGVARKGANVRIIRDGEVIGNGIITDIRRFKDQVKEVIAGLECGIMIDGFKDYQAEDKLEIFEKIKIKQTL
ncbi:translation initiation factor IF-2 [bacterium]|nr:translation initiation factor IF-2 [bacterium]